MTRMIRSSVAWVAALGLVLSVPLVLGAAEQDSDSPAVGAEGSVQQEVDEKLAERRAAMMKEAHAALDETNAALQALNDGNTDAALEALARATGKLELVVARDPELALAPVGVDLITHDLYATPAAIRAARDQAEELLEDGRVQDARALLSGLASELVIRVTNLPLATYPEAIKAITPLIDEGKIEEAKTALQAALNTLVVTKEIVSLPVLRAQHMLREAETLLSEAEAPEGADDSEASSERSTEVEKLLADAREQLEMAELLGYGEKRDHAKFREQIAQLEKKIEADEDTQGLFARLRKTLDEYQTSFIH